MDATVFAQLVSLLPRDAVLTQAATLENYRYDSARDPTAGTPIAVVRPTCADQVRTTLKWAHEHRVPVVPRGAGSGLSGGSSALDGGIVISMERMQAVEIYPDMRVAVVEPGALNVDVKKSAARHGLWYPPDPASFEFCSIGGNIATNAGGLCCVKYGVTKDYVLGLDVVLADGTEVVLGGPRIKDVAGLSLVQLFVGSEGTLGIVTRATLRLVPTQDARATLVALFRSVEAAAGAVVEITRNLRPSMLELMDRAAINVVEDFKPMGLDRQAGALILVQSDAPGDTRGLEVAAIREACLRNAATDVFVTSDAAEGEMFAAARRTMFPALEARGSLMLEDVAVPIPRLSGLLTGVAVIADRQQVEVPVVAHAGDGNAHPVIVFDPTDVVQCERAGQAFQHILDLAISLGGTITGEHGVGRLKKKSLPTQLGDDVMALSWRIKHALDPRAILNPGAVL
jgi:glycolate oxidase